MNIKPKYDRHFHHSKLNPHLLRTIQAQIAPLREALGWFGFADIYSGEIGKRDLAYSGLGVTYSPHFIGDVEPLAQVMGEARKNIPVDFFKSPEGRKFYQFLLEHKIDKDFFNQVAGWSTAEISEWLKPYLKPDQFSFLSLIEKMSSNISSKMMRKYSYADCYAFTERTEVGHAKGISDIIDSVPLQIIRSRLAELSSHHLDESRQNFLWHRDDHPVREFRMLICLSTSHEHFGIEFKSGERHYLNPGDVLFFDTSQVHRAFTDSFQKGSRLCLILGFSPWFDYSKSEDVWRPNQYCGRVHPFDLISLFSEKNILQRLN